ncbi:MAG: hypothetical protein SFV54_21880 [Bryobacteraceae bacterium]|nr:hypothetical protein [Bryobacteraceae bacterium]
MLEAMSDGERARLREHVERWKRAGAELERLRAEELRSVDTREAVRQLFGVALPVRKDEHRWTTSGLVEQQAWFAKLRKSESR